MTSEARPLAVLEILDHVYAGVLDPTRWQDALRSFATLLDARAAGVRVERPGEGVEQEWVGLEPSFDRAYVAHYWQDDPWAEKIWCASVGAFSHGNGVCARSIVEASAFHNELALPSGLDDLAGGVLERTPSRVVTIGVMKGAGNKRFDAETDRLSAMVGPHFARGLALRDRLKALAPEGSRSPRRSARTLGALVEARLRTDHSLTVTEARVALRIGNGLSPKEIAAEFGTSWYTVRSQLREVFAKTERRTQSALARLVTLLEAEVALDLATSRAPRR